jgi:sigma-54 dependent transcriptional regulator, acetoin dehydrogenase operon transcriptional activator AcoR
MHTSTSDNRMENSVTFEDAECSQRLQSIPFRSHLFVVLECDRAAAGSTRHELTEVDEIVIGRGPERRAVKESNGNRYRLRVTIPGRSMSHVHARIVRRGTDWILEDANSTNGSFLNGQRVATAAVCDGDCIEVGHTLLTLRTALPTPPDTPESFEYLEAAQDGRRLTTTLPALASTYRELVTIAPSPVPIVLVGRTGTGKEVLARHIHMASRRPGTFVAVNCGALAPNLIESQLFGHVRGAFSGAVGSEIGFIRSADQGTLLLDELEELPASAQVALLRILQESEVVPVGSARPVRVDVRVIAATHQGLADLVEQRRLRDDVRGRLEGYSVVLPPLAERREDLGILVAELLASIDGAHGLGTRRSLHPTAGRLLWSHDWPLNIRELEHALRHATALAQGGDIDVKHLPASMTAPPTEHSVPSTSGGRRHSNAPAGHLGEVARVRLELSEADGALRREIICRLEEQRGNIAAVAKSMGKARTQVQRWLARFGVDADAYRH